MDNLWGYLHDDMEWLKCMCKTETIRETVPKADPRISHDIAYIYEILHCMRNHFIVSQRLFTAWRK